MAGVAPKRHLPGELLSAYLDGELLAGELDEVVAHLSACEPCIAEFHELKLTRTWLRTLPELVLPERVMASVHLGVELSAYLDGELQSDERADVVRHLARCEYCRAELRDLDAARTAVRSLPRLEPPVSLEVERQRRAPLRRWRVATVAAGIAAVAVIAVGVTAAESDPAAEVDLDSFADRHVARASVEPGFAVIPVVGPSGGTP